MRIVPQSGKLIVNGLDAALARVLKKGHWTPVEYFGVDSGWAASKASADGSFDVSLNERLIGRVRWDLQGAHNRLNALAAIAAASHAGVGPDLAVAALGEFLSVKRRMELIGTIQGIAVYDDFAHHPTAIATTIEGLRRKVGPARILAVLEPRSNTMKQGVIKAALPGSVADADRVYVFDSGLEWGAKEVFSPVAGKTSCEDDLDDLVEAIARDAKPGDHILVMSNGGFGGIHEKLLARLSK